MAKKNVEETKVTEEVIEEPEVEVVEEPVAEEETVNEETEEVVEEEKKENFAKKWINTQKEEWKTHPVKKAGKTLFKGAVTVLAVIGGKTVYNAFKDNTEVITDTVSMIQDNANDVVETITE